ncbi:hypothetical protein IPG41_07140 [Candidatus Peregrinibacteria bacterium]|nr:MAG: hypothetical protein IPG41_07140 [Candidatus Peregrinibacteria bacterium]
MAFKIGKKHLCSFLLSVVLALVLNLTLGALPTAFASSFLPLPGTEGLNIATPEGNTAIEKLENFLGPFARNLRIILGGLAVLFIVVSGFTMVVSGDNEETAKTQRKSIVYGCIGLMMISIAGPIAEVFDYRQGNFISDPSDFTERVRIFDNVTQLIITFLKYLLGGLATLMAVRAGAMLVMSGDNDDDVSKAKKQLTLSLAGLMLIFVSNLVIRRIFYVATYSTNAEATIVQLDQNEFIRQLVAVTNLMISFLGPIMMLGIVIGGFLYVTSQGEEEKTGLAKKIITNSIIGIVIIYGAFALVSTLIAGQF